MSTLEDLEKARDNLIQAAQDHYDHTGYKILIMDYAPGWCDENPDCTEVILTPSSLDRLRDFLEPRYSIVDNEEDSK